MQPILVIFHMLYEISGEKRGMHDCRNVWGNTLSPQSSCVTLTSQDKCGRDADPTEVTVQMNNICTVTPLHPVFLFKISFYYKHTEDTTLTDFPAPMQGQDKGTNITLP